MDLTVVAYATLALSLFVSAVKMGGWILNADPRAIINSGRWALLALVALALGVLGWLLATGRWTSAMMRRAGACCSGRSTPPATTLRLPRGILASRGRAG